MVSISIIVLFNLFRMLTLSNRNSSEVQIFSLYVTGNTKRLRRQPVDTVKGNNLTITHKYMLQQSAEFFNVK